MRRSSTILALITVGTVLSPQAGSISMFVTPSLVFADTIPFTMYVQQDNIPLRSGPGESYAITEELTMASPVEVYRKSAGDWYGIRPTDASFSWVAAAYLEPTDEKDVARVTEDKVPAHIGSTFDDVRGLAQVKLDRDELVQLLGSRRSEAGDLWYRIAPPPGEFRWIHADDLARERPVVVKLDSQPDQATAGVPSLPSDDALAESLMEPITEVTATEVGTGAIATSSDTAEFAHHVDAIGAAVSSNSAVVQAAWTARNSGDRGGQGPADASSGGREQTGHAADARENVQIAASPPAPADPTSNTGAALANFAERLATLDVELSREVVGEPTTWKLDPLRRQARDLATADGTTTERAKARLLLKKVAEFEDIQFRYRDLEADASQPLAAAASGAAGPAGLGDGTAARSDSLFDGRGWLMPIVTRRRDIPRYALTDDHGRILYFISPGRGVNLNHFVRQQVGVNGQTEILPQLKRSHITARRIVELQRFR